MLFSDLLRRNATRFPHRDALVMTDGSGGRTYAQLYERSCRLANALSALAGRGDRVALLSENNLEYVEAYYGVPAAGMTLAMLNYRLHPQEWVWILNDCRRQGADRRGEVPARDRGRPRRAHQRRARHRDRRRGTRRHDVRRAPRRGLGRRRPRATSPTTRPPGCSTPAAPPVVRRAPQLTHRNLNTALVQSVIAYEPKLDTVFLNAMPLCHVAGYLTPIYQFQGGTVLMMSGWDPEEWLRLVETHSVTSGGFAPTMMQMLLAHPKVNDYDLSSLEWMGYGASKIPVDVLRRTIERFGPIVYAGMGMTELGGNMLTLDKAAHIRAVNGEE